MSITYPLDSPTQFGVSALTWGPMTNTARAKAPWTFQDIVQVFAAEMWTGELSIALQTEADGRALAAWITSLKGTRGTFKLGDPAISAPLGSAAVAPGTPVIDGVGQTGNQLAISGLPAGAQGYLLAGDMLQVGAFPISAPVDAHLHMVLTDVDVDGAGKATLDIFPTLRESPTNQSAVVLVNPQGVFALAQPFTPWQVRSPLLYDGVKLSVAEVI